MARQWTIDLSPLKTSYIKEYLTDAPYLILVFKQTYGKILSEVLEVLVRRCPRALIG